MNIPPEAFYGNEELTETELELYMIEKRRQIDKYRSEPHTISEPKKTLCKNANHCGHPTCTRFCCACGFIKAFHYQH